MALSKEIVAPSGVVAHYHHIAAYHWRKPYNLFIEIASFASAELRYDGKEPIMTTGVQLEIDGAFDHTMESMYTLLKATPEWSDATDI